MLTGDKFETAENIGFSCRLLNKDMHIFRINSDEDTENFCSEATLAENKILMKPGDKYKDRGLIVEGK